VKGFGFIFDGLYGNEEVLTKDSLVVVELGLRRLAQIIPGKEPPFYQQ
jgi:hypothetical protein